MKQCKRIMILVSVFVVVLASSIYAKSSNKGKALKAYSKMLSKQKISLMPQNATVGLNDMAYKYKTTKTSKAQFGLIYIDDDKVPELIVKSVDTYSIKYEGDVWKTKITVWAIYTFKKGKIYRVDSGDGNTILVGYYKKKGTYYKKAHGSGASIYHQYFKLNGKKAKEIMHYFHDPEYEYDPEEDEYWGSPDKYIVNKKEVSKSTYKKAYNKSISGTKLSKVIFRKNTKTNRKKYLK